MPGRDYHEAVWEAVPQGVAPCDARLRERLLLERLARVEARDGGAPRVLDLGCGEGHFAALLARAGAQVVAVDVAQEPLRRARATHPELDLRPIDPEAKLPFEDCSFDALWAGEVIEHVSDTLGFMSEARRVLRSGGVLLLSTPHHGWLRRLSLGCSRRRFEAHFDPRSEHLRFYTPRTLSNLLADLGFECVELDTAGGPPGARRVLFASAVRRRF